MQTATVEAPAVVLQRVDQHQAPAVMQGAGGLSNQEAGSLIHIIAAAARDPSVDIDKMERLWAMHERLKNRAAEEAFNAAMNKAQGEMGRVSADAANQQTRSVYATYGKLDRAVRPIYARNGFSLSFDTGEGAPEGYTRVLAYVSHSAGHTRTYHADMPADGKGAKGGDVMTKTHASGAAMSYGMRYLLRLIFNIAVGEEDNDGNDEGDADRELTPAEKTRQSLTDAGRNAAMSGMASLTKWWGGLNAKQRSDMNSEFGSLRKAARAADEGSAA